VQPFVQPFCPQPHARLVGGIGGTQRRPGNGIVDEFVDDRRLDDHDAVVNESRDDRIRIELEVFRFLLIARTQIEMVRAPSRALLCERKAHFLGASRHVVMIELQHLTLPDDATTPQAARDHAADPNRPAFLSE
jgi:hypothetical protein